MAMITILAKSLGIKTIVTEHSHFAYHDVGLISMNKISKWYLKDIDAAITVSNSCKENFTLRSKIDPRICFTIPNAVDTIKFAPNPSMRFPLNTINIVCVSRLTQRKGIDFLIDIIPAIMKIHPNAHFIIGGNGERYEMLQELV